MSQPGCFPSSCLVKSSSVQDKALIVDNRRNKYLLTDLIVMLRLIPNI